MTQRQRLFDALEKLPALYATDGNVDPETRPAVFAYLPGHTAQWILWEYDPTDRRAFGLCDLGYPEIGYVDVDELATVRSQYRLPVEVDDSMTVAAGYRMAGVTIPDWL